MIESWETFYSRKESIVVRKDITVEALPRTGPINSEARSLISFKREASISRLEL